MDNKNPLKIDESKISPISTKFTLKDRSNEQQLSEYENLGLRVIAEG